MSVSELSPSAISANSAISEPQTTAGISATGQSICSHSDSIGAHQAGRHVEFPAAVHEVLTSLRTLTGIPNWALTRQRSDGSLTILSPARRTVVKPAAATSETQTAKFLTGAFVLNGDNYRDHHNADHQNADHQNADHQNADDHNADHQNADDQNADHQNADDQNADDHNADHHNADELIEPASTRAFVLDRRKHLPVFLVDVLDAERNNTFGNLVGYRTGRDLRDESPIAPADAALAGLLASMLASVLAQDRRHQLERRAEERMAYPERDSVTGCLERSAWIRLLESEALRLHRFDDEALMVAISIENLAEIKRKHGIEAAEEFRREVSYALHSTTSSASLVAHLADDSYASLLCSTDPTAELRAFRSRVELLNLPVRVTVGQRFPAERSLHAAQRRAGLV